MGVVGSVGLGLSSKIPGQNTTKHILGWRLTMSAAVRSHLATTTSGHTAINNLMKSPSAYPSLNLSHLLNVTKCGSSQNQNLIQNQIKTKMSASSIYAIVNGKPTKAIFSW